MSISLYSATIPSYLQIIASVSNLLDRAEEHCESNDLLPETLTQAHLAPDMLPFAYQITSVAHHSAGAIEGLRRGTFSPDKSTPPTDFQSLKDIIINATSTLQQLNEGELESLIGKPMCFQMTGYKIDFVAEEFLLSFSQPNFYFHAATAYDILRWKGLEIGKTDFLGKIRRIP